MTNLHAAINGPTTTFRRDPNNILTGVLDITGLAMHTVLSIDVKFMLVMLVFNVLINASRAIA